MNTNTKKNLKITAIGLANLAFAGASIWSFHEVSETNEKTRIDATAAIRNGQVSLADHRKFTINGNSFEIHQGKVIIGREHRERGYTLHTYEEKPRVNAETCFMISAQGLQTSAIWVDKNNTILREGAWDVVNGQPVITDCRVPGPYRYTNNAAYRAS